MQRLAKVHTSLADKLLFRSMQGYEGISSLFHYSIEMVSLDGSIDLNSLLGQPLSLQIKQKDAPDHWLNGDIVSLGLKGMEGGSSRYSVYQAEVRPKLWYLTQNKDFRIFQEKTVPEIIKEVLKDFNIQPEDKLTQNYRSWGYCVQYNESAFDFISRLMEHEGIYYYFTHSNGEHQLVLTDSQSVHEPILYPLIPYRGPNAGVILDEICVDNWQVYDEIKPSMVSMNDYDFHKPYATLLDVQNNPASYAPERTEVFEWPGRFIDKSHAEFYTRTRKQEEAAQHERMHGSATSSLLTPGSTFTLIKAPRENDNQEYLIAQTNYSVWDNSYASGEDANRGQRVDFTVIPASIVWRTPRTTPWPKTQGPQTAQVVCPPGETIWTDKYGRVKVKFHWDRYAKGDDTSSCWIRVASSWAGQGYGGVQIPRLNDEVVVDFINGDPDRPIIIGRVYNEANMPPWDLPDNATQMGFFSRSKTGHKGTANALRFEDKLGQEQLWIQAEKNMDSNIKNDETHSVGNNQANDIAVDQTTSVGSNQSTSVGANQTISVSANRTLSVGGDESSDITGNKTLHVVGDETITIDANQKEDITGTRTLTVTGADTQTINSTQDTSVTGAQTLTVSATKTDDITGLMKADYHAGHKVGVTGAQDFIVTAKHTTDAQQVYIKADVDIILTCGSSKITMTTGGKIDIEGIDISIKGTNITVDGTNITSKASADHITTGVNVSSDGSAENIVAGGIVKLNP